MSFAMPRFGLKKLVATATLALAAGSLSTIATSPAAHAESDELTYTCTVPILGDQSFTVVADTNAPASVTVGDTFTPKVTATVTIPENVRGAVYGLLDARTAEGTGQAQTLVDGVASTVDLSVPTTEIPDSGSLTVVATGTGAPVEATEAGEIVLSTGDFTSHLEFKKEDGSEALTADVPCSLDEGQDATVDTVTVITQACATAQDQAKDASKALTKAKAAVTKSAKAVKKAKKALKKAKKALKKAKKTKKAKKIKAAKKKLKKAKKQLKQSKKKLAKAKATQKKAVTKDKAAKAAVKSACSN